MWLWGETDNVSSYDMSHLMMPQLHHRQTWLSQPLSVSTVPNTGRNLPNSSYRGLDEEDTSLYRGLFAVLSLRYAGLDIGLWQPLARGASESENPLAPQKTHGPPKKTCNDPNVFTAGIYDFTREVAHFCTLGLYITKKKYELTLPSEFCRFPVKNNGGIRSTKKKKKTLAPRAGGK